MSARLRALPPAVAIALAATGIGFLVVLNTQAAFLVVLLAAGIAALSAPAAGWALAAVIATLTFRGLVQLGLLPSIATFADIGLGWGALLIAQLHRGGSSKHARPLLLRLGVLAVATVAAWGFHRSEVFRPLLYLALLGLPFALLGALLVEPPSPRLRRLLVRALVALIALQVPIAFAQAAGHFISGRGDAVQGTLYGAGAGTDTMSAIVAVGGIWLLAATSGIAVWWRLPLAALALSVPLIADAKQVTLALPAGLLAISARRPRTLLIQAVAVGGAVAALFEFAPAGAPTYLRQAELGRGGKEAAAAFIWTKLRGDPASIAFGLGPAETVSRAAFMTTPLFLGQRSPLHIFGLRPAEVAMEAQAESVVVSGGGTSFNSGVSSAIGVFGDLGVIGLLTYLALPVWVIRRVRGRDVTFAVPAAAGWGMLLVLGLVYDWWEQPPFSIVLAALAGLALTSSGQRGRSPLIRAKAI
jgi:hypothetical protein